MSPLTFAWLSSQWETLGLLLGRTESVDPFSLSSSQTMNPSLNSGAGAARMSAYAFCFRPAQCFELSPHIVDDYSFRSSLHCLVALSWFNNLKSLYASTWAARFLAPCACFIMPYLCLLCYSIVFAMFWDALTVLWASPFNYVHMEVNVWCYIPILFWAVWIYLLKRKGHCWTWAASCTMFCKWVFQCVCAMCWSSPY